MLDYLIVILFFIICIIGLIFYLLSYWTKRLSVLKNNVVYSDSEKFPGFILRSNRIPLNGKPDFLIKVKGTVYPVEFKKTTSPREPYQNHIMQLMAYCFLVEERFGKRPEYGIIKYFDKEFKVSYTVEKEQDLKRIVGEILECKKSGKELFCNHRAHN